jgi:hypothetical protein
MCFFRTISRVSDFNFKPRCLGRVVMARKVFFSFHYEPDNWTASQVRNIGAIEGNEPCSDNDWESIKRGGDQAIERWIAKQLEGRTCTIVLVGAETANRKWVIHEIQESWNKGMGVVGIRIHNLKNRYGLQSSPGSNPFTQLHFVNKTDKYLSSVAKLYDPPYQSSTDVYSYIAKNLQAWIDEAISTRDNFVLQ